LNVEYRQAASINSFFRVQNLKLITA